MEQYVVKGGTPLKGKVSIGGAKNAAGQWLASDDDINNFLEHDANA